MYCIGLSTELLAFSIIIWVNGKIRRFPECASSYQFGMIENFLEFVVSTIQECINRLILFSLNHDVQVRFLRYEALPRFKCSRGRCC